MHEYLDFKRLVLRYLCYIESIFVCLFLIELDMTFCRYCLLTFAPTTTLKNFDPIKDISVLSNLDKITVVKIRLCIIYQIYRFVSGRFHSKISRVSAVPTIKKFSWKRYIVKGCSFENCIYPAGTQRLYNVSFRAYLRYVIY